MTEEDFEYQDPVSELGSKLRVWLNGFCERDPRYDVTRYDPKRSLVPDECEIFLRGVDSQIIQVDAEGRCTLPGLRKTGSFDLFWAGSRTSSDPKIFLWRELLMQAGIIAELILGHGWPLDCIAIDDGPFDAVVYREGEPWIAVEAKETRPLLDSMLSEMTSWEAKPGLVESSNARRKAQALYERKIPYFFAVAPGIRRLFSAVHDERRLYFAEIEKYSRLAALRGQDMPCSDLRRRDNTGSKRMKTESAKSGWLMPVLIKTSEPIILPQAPTGNREYQLRTLIEGLEGCWKDLAVDVYRHLVLGNYTACEGKSGHTAEEVLNRTGYDDRGMLPDFKRRNRDGAIGMLLYNIIRHDSSPKYKKLNSFVAGLLEAGYFEKKDCSINIS